MFERVECKLLDLHENKGNIKLMTQQEFNNQIMHTLGSMESSLKDIRKALFGNGQPGMTKRLNDVEVKVDNHLQIHKEEGKKIFNWQTTLAATVVGSLVTGVFMLLAEALKLI